VWWRASHGSARQHAGPGRITWRLGAGQARGRHSSARFWRGIESSQRRRGTSAERRRRYGWVEKSALW